MRREHSVAFGECSTALFHPRKSLPDGYYAVTEDNEILFTYCLFPCTENRTKNTLVFFHGNGEIVEDYYDSLMLKEVRKSMNMCMVEYRGYGYFSDHKPNILEMMEDVKRLGKALELKCNIKDENIIVMGRSIGSLFAAEYGRQFPKITGVIMESGFGNATSFYMQRLKHKVEIEEEECKQHEEEANITLNNCAKMEQFPGSLLIFHAKDDKVVPFSNSNDLFNACTTTKKQLVLFEIGMHNPRSYNREEYFHHMNAFIDSIYPPKKSNSRKSSLLLITAIAIVAVAMIAMNL